MFGESGVSQTPFLFIYFCSMRYLILVFAVSMASCNSSNYAPEALLSEQEAADWVRKLSVYVDTRPNDIQPADRFDAQYQGYYDTLVQTHQSRLEAFHQEGELFYFLYVKKDIKSLYEHYRYVGGMCKLDADGNISWLDQRFYSPRLGSAEMGRGQELFKAMVKQGDISAYYGNFNYIEWPDADFVYSPEKREWVLQDTSQLRGIAPMIKE